MIIIPLIATFLVSIIPVLLLHIIPLFKFGRRHSIAKKRILTNGMLCFASGSLLGDSFLHLTTENGCGIWILLGISMFFIIDRFSRLSQSEKANSGYLALIADSVHNFTDGMTISATFHKGSKFGWTTTLAIFLHEIPHELGDYAILVKSGFSHSEIIYSQLLTGAIAFLGTIFGLVASGRFDKFILPFSAGGFIYISLCSILSEVLSDRKAHTQFNAIIDVSLFIFGGLFMLMVE